MTPSAMTATQAGEFRAAGTDLSERRRSGVSTGPLIDIAAAPDTIGVHWGTFELTDESLDEPPRQLADARRAKGVADDAFITLAIGETRKLPRRAVAPAAAAASAPQ